MTRKEKGARLRMRPGKFLALTVVPMTLVLVVALLLTVAGTAFAPTLGALFGEGAQTVQNPEVPRRALPTTTRRSMTAPRKPRTLPTRRLPASCRRAPSCSKTTACCRLRRDPR